MLVNTLMAYSVIRKGWKWPMWAVASSSSGAFARGVYSAVTPEGMTTPAWSSL